MPDTNTSIAMSFACPNYSGALYTKSNIETPFLNAIGALLYTKSAEFATSPDYALEEPSQPAISEADSVKGVDATFITRSQKTNVTQIFQEAVCVSYATLIRAYRAKEDLQKAVDILLGIENDENL